MPVNTQELMNVLCRLSEEENLRVTVNESAKGGIIAGISTMLGGVLLGPAGLFLGGVLGGCSAAYFAKGKFVPLAIVINNMSVKEKERLRCSIERVLRDLDITDLFRLSLLLTNNYAVKRALLHEIVSYFHSQMRLEVID